MLLLDPSEIKDEKKENANQSQRLIHALSEEEARINKEVNLLREESKVTKDAIKLETDNYVAEQAERRDALDKEVVALESRRAEALKPILQDKEEANTLLNEAKQALNEAKAIETTIEEDKEELLDLAEKLNDKEADLNDREAKIEAREEKATAEESRLKDSANTLADKWVKFHSAVNISNTDIENRTKRLDDREKVLDTRKEQLDERDIFQSNHARRIKDQYATLGRAVDEAKKKYNVII